MSETMGERMAVIETETRQIKECLEKHIEDTNESMKNLNQKIDDLLELKNKGMGAFWLASTIVGSGIIGGIVALYHWLKGG